MVYFVEIDAFKTSFRLYGKKIVIVTGECLLAGSLRGQTYNKSY